MQTLNFTDFTANYIIFDMDGVLVDTAPVTRNAAKAALSEIGIKAESIDFTKYAGMGEKNFITGPCSTFGRLELCDNAIDRFYEIFAENVKNNIKIFPDVLQTLARLNELHIPLALASSSATEKLEQTLAAAKIKKDWFDVIVSGDEVCETKPSPRIFNTAIQRLGANPCECLVVEDAVSGVLAAKAAKAKCFAVTNTFTKEQLLQAGADYTGSSINDILKYIPSKGGF